MNQIQKALVTILGKDTVRDNDNLEFVGAKAFEVAESLYSIATRNIIAEPRERLDAILLINSILEQ